MEPVVVEPLLQQQAALLPLGAGGVGPLASSPVTRQGGPLHSVTRVTLQYICRKYSNGKYSLKVIYTYFEDKGCGHKSGEKQSVEEQLHYGTIKSEIRINS